MKSQLNFFFWLSLARNTCTAQVVTDVKHFIFQKRNLTEKTFFGHFDHRFHFCSVYITRYVNFSLNLLQTRHFAKHLKFGHSIHTMNMNKSLETVDFNASY